MAYGIQEVGFLLEGANWCAMLYGVLPTVVSPGAIWAQVEPVSISDVARWFGYAFWAVKPLEMDSFEPG
jgi:hypothetical protein